MINFIKYTRFRLWRWWFLRYKLPKITHKGLNELKREYSQYCQSVWDKGYAALSIEDWCREVYAKE